MTEPTNAPAPRAKTLARQVEQYRAQVERSRRTLEALYNMSLASRGQVAYRPVFEALARELRSLFSLDALYIAVCDTRNAGMFRAALLIDEAIVEYEEDTPYGNHTRQLVERRAPILYRDLPAERAGVPPNPDSLFGDRQKVSRSWLGVPLLLGPETDAVGVISVQSYQPGLYDADDLALLQQIGNLAAVALENVTLAQNQRELSQLLVAQVEARSRELRALGALAAEMVREQPLPALLERAVDLITQVFGADGVMVRLADPERDELVVAAERGYPEEYSRTQARVKIAGTMQGRIISEDRPLVLGPGDAAVLDGLGLPFRAAISLPLRIGERRLGTLSLASLAPRTYDDQQISVAQAFADQVAIAVESARLFAERDRQVAELAALSNIAHAASTALDLPTLLRRTCNALAEFMPLDAFNMVVYDPQTQIITDGVSIDEGEEYAYWRRQPPPPGSLTGWIIANRRALHFDDLPAELERNPDLARYLVGSARTSLSWLGVPLFNRDDNVIGVIAVQSYTRGVFSARDERFLVNVAGQVALHVQNVSLLARRERQIRELDAIDRIGRALSATLDLDEMLMQIYQTLRDVTGASSFYQVICDPDTYEISRSFYMDRGEPFAHTWPDNRPPSGSLTAWILSNREPLLFFDLPGQGEELARRGITPHTFGSESQPRSWIGVPLFDQHDRPIGVIVLQDERAYQYDQQTIEFLSQIASHLSLGIQKVQLFEEAQEHAAAAELHAKRVEQVYRISLVLSSQLDQDELLGRAARELTRLFDADHAGIVIFDEDDRFGTVVAEYPPLGESARVRMSNQGNPLFDELVATRRPICIASVADDPRTAAIRPFAAPFGITSMMVTPLVSRGRVIGSIGIDSIGRARDFSADEQTLALTLAASVAAAVENARLFAAEQQARRTADTLREVARLLSSTFDPDELIQIILRELHQVIPYDTSSIMLLERQALRIVALRGWKQKHSPRNAVFPLSRKSGAALVVRRGEPVMIADTEQSDDWAPGSFGAEIRSWLGVPLVSQGRVLGVLNIDSRRPARFSERDVEVALAFASQAAVSLENARLYEESVTRVEEELALARQIQSNLFPRALPAAPRLALAAACIPARETGGDFFDCFLLGEPGGAGARREAGDTERAAPISSPPLSPSLLVSEGARGDAGGLLAIMVGDASGKSIPGAMLMAVARSVARSEAHDHALPEVVMCETNSLVTHDIPRGSFVALCYATLDLRSLRLACANAGQLAPLLLRAGRIEYLEPPGPTLPLGIAPDLPYAALGADLAPGDTLVFYTDGVVEARNAARELFGFERLEALVRELGEGPPAALIEAVLAAVRAFIGDAPQHDDMTLVVARVTE